jgi:hypothetical protein
MADNEGIELQRPSIKLRLARLQETVQSLERAAERMMTRDEDETLRHRIRDARLRCDAMMARQALLELDVRGKVVALQEAMTKRQIDLLVARLGCAPWSVY